ncbi:hypothetical protein [Streptomyces sp. NPDC051684]|uniref:hypothetical protein n=1 Tax=Streptomyces sp. NPDC051684 TaxID=3365670 RepID=UPI0037A672C4
MWVQRVMEVAGWVPLGIGVDWAAVEGELGVVLPVDCKEFCEAFGGGVFGEGVYFLGRDGGRRVRCAGAVASLAGRRPGRPAGKRFRRRPVCDGGIEQVQRAGGGTVEGYMGGASARPPARGDRVLHSGGRIVHPGVGEPIAESKGQCGGVELPGGARSHPKPSTGTRRSHRIPPCARGSGGIREEPVGEGVSMGLTNAIPISIDQLLRALAVLESLCCSGTASTRASGTDGMHYGMGLLAMMTALVT